MEVYSKLSPTDQQKFVDQSVKDFHGDNALLPLPRVFSAEDMDILKKGVSQRARALQLFLKDYYSGQKGYATSGVIPEAAVQAALNRSMENGLPDFSASKSFNFWYGPDVLRDSNGNFRVVEDNLGFIGGMGDLALARKSLIKNIPEYKDAVNKTASPDFFYEKMAENYKAMAQENGGIALLISYPPKMSSDNEDVRVRKIFKNHGVETFNFREKNNSEINYLSMEKDGLYLITPKPEKAFPGRTKVPKKKKVGHVILDLESQHIDALYDKNYRRHVFDEVENVVEGTNVPKADRLKVADLGKRDPITGEWDEKPMVKWLQTRGKKLFGSSGLEPTGYEGFWELVKDGKVSVTNQLGNEFINDKGFYPYVEDLIRHYLNEEPILKNIETFPAVTFDKNGNAVPNQEILARAKKSPADYVIKGVNGRGGDSVWIGKKMTQAEFESVLGQVSKNPLYYIFQKYTPLSVIKVMGEDYIVDARLISDVSSTGVISAGVPWVRATPKSGNGKVNISDRGKEVTGIAENPVDCNKLLH